MFRRIGDLLDCRSDAESMIAGFKLTAGEIARRRRASKAEPSQPRRVHAAGVAGPAVLLRPLEPRDH